MQIPSWQFLGIILEDPYFQLCPAWGSLRGSHQCPCEQKHPWSCCLFGRGKLWKAEQPLPWVLLCCSWPPSSGQFTSELRCFAFWRRNTKFFPLLLSRCVLTASCPSDQLVRFSLPLHRLFQLNCHWGGTIARPYTDLISVKFYNLWTCLVKFMM